MTFITSDTTAGEASFLLGWAIYELLSAEHPARVRFPDDEDGWLTAPGHTMFVPVDDGTPVSEFADQMTPIICREVERQLATRASTNDWFIELDSWAHAVSGDSERIDDGLRLDVVVQVRY